MQIEKQRLNEIILHQKTEQELGKAENAYLKAQINPHFLFNTLDYVYHQIRELSAPAAEAIIALAEIMRYAIDGDKLGDTIVLEEEIHQVKCLTYLHQLRKIESDTFNFIYPDEISNLHFLPLVLLTLAENIFKHGLLTKEYPAWLEVKLEEEMLVIKSTNQIDTAKNNSISGKGLVNIQKRLTYAYGNSLFFQFGPDKSSRFNVTIKLPVRYLDGTVPQYSV